MVGPQRNACAGISNRSVIRSKSKTLRFSGNKNIPAVVHGDRVWEVIKIWANKDVGPKRNAARGVGHSRKGIGVTKSISRCKIARYKDIPALVHRHGPSDITSPAVKAVGPNGCAVGGANARRPADSAKQRNNESVED